MKTRQIEILKYILSDTEVSVDKMSALYDISKRTFYYDLEFINSVIKDYGVIRNLKGVLTFFGDQSKLNLELDEILLNPFYEAKERQDIIFYTLMMDSTVTIDQLSDTLQVSKTTVFSDIASMKSDFTNLGIDIHYNQGYLITGNEWLIRDLFISLLDQNLDLFKSISENVISLNKNHQLLLTDYSLSRFELLSTLVRYRISNGNTIGDYKTGIALTPDLQPDLEKIINSTDEDELRYILTYLLSLSSTRIFDKSEYINDFIHELNYKIECQYAITIDNDYFNTNLRNHLMASRLRIKHKFPALNPSLSDIKLKYSNLFHSLKKFILEDLDFNDFKGMRDEEIGFIAAYYGGYMQSLKNNSKKVSKVLLVCPHGLSVSTQLEIQIRKLLPNTSIIGALSINNLSVNLLEDYDYVISTIQIPSISNLIVVNPILSNTDRINLLGKFGQSYQDGPTIPIDSILEIVRENTVIVDEERLSRKLLELFKHQNKGGDKMLSELLKPEMINLTHDSLDWKEAITKASQPLLESGKIEAEYIDDMIESIENHGPYIVLADNFALPHASGTKNVHELSMSMLQLSEPVDMKGKSVKVFVVLATPDNNSHLRALSTMSEILMDGNNLETFVNGTKESILSLILETEENET